MKKMYENWQEGMNIAVTTLATDNLPYQKEVFENRRQYCDEHDYFFRTYSNSFDSRPANWSKFKIILELFEVGASRSRGGTLDWVLWTDSDAVITNQKIKLEEIIDNNFDLILTEDCYAYNTGVFLIKNSILSKKLLYECLEKEQYIGHPWEDQAALVEVLESSNNYKVKVLPQRTLNSYPAQESHKGWFTVVNEKQYHWNAEKAKAGEYEKGDFIIHFAGFSEEEKSKSVLSLLRKKNLCMLSFATEDIGLYAKKIFKSNKSYAKKHDYDWKEYWGVIDDSRPPAWSKILYILKILEEGHDWVFWIDADAIIMNDSIPLEKFIDDEYDFILCKDAFSWNTGAWFVKNSDKAKELLLYTYSKEKHIDAMFWEQGAFVNAAFEKGARIKVHPQRDFNSVAKETREFFTAGVSYECGAYKFVLDMEEYDKGMYEDGDFIVHFASINHAGRDMLLKEYRPDLYDEAY